MFQKFPSIDQFKSVVAKVNKANKREFIGLNEHGEPQFKENRPTLTFVGHTKVHGTNAGIILTPEGEIEAQGRNRTLKIGADNYGFAQYVKTNEDQFREMIEKFKGTLEEREGKHLSIFGEWCGGSIQSGVGITGLDRMFIIFAAAWTSTKDNEVEREWLDINGIDVVDMESVHLITEYAEYYIDIDFNDPHSSFEELNDLTLKVEDECPVAFKHGVSEGTGEGIVWKCVSEGYGCNGYWFKHKGTKHQRGGKAPKVPKEIDPMVQAKVEKFIPMAVTTDRLEQGIEYLNEMQLELSKKSTGQYLAWVCKDIIKEEIDKLVELELEWSDTVRYVESSVREWFFDRINQDL